MNFCSLLKHITFQVRIKYSQYYCHVLLYLTVTLLSNHFYNQEMSLPVYIRMLKKTMTELIVKYYRIICIAVDCCMSIH